MPVVDTVRSPRQVLVGEGTAETLPSLCAQLGRRVLVVTDRVLLDQPQIRAVIDDVREAAEESLVFSDASPDVPLSDVDVAMAAAAELDADVLVAIGGGTVIDLAKIVGAVHRYGGTARDYYGECRVPGPTPPLVAAPTTSGTGSEVSPVAVLNDPERELKVGVSSVHLVPDFAVVDPTLTWSCPSVVTAHSGIDAFCHAVESYTARERPFGPRDLIETVFVGRNGVTDDFALRAARAIGPNLATAVADGEDRHARGEMAVGSMWAGLAFSHAGTAAPHALQYPIGAATKTSHGLGVGLLLPYALAAARDAVADRLVVLAECVGMRDREGAPPEVAHRFIQWVTKLLDDIGIPATLADIGIERRDLPRLAEKATHVGRILRNHPGRTDVEALTTILEAAWLGDLGRADVRTG